MGLVLSLLSSSLLGLLLLASQGLRFTEGKNAIFALAPHLSLAGLPLFQFTFLSLNSDAAIVAGRVLHRQIKKLPEVEQTAMSAVLIGSRPPRCEGKCALCGRCEAVQVPVAPRDRRREREEAGRLRLIFPRAVRDRVGESSTNYKPLNWKCRCADRSALDP
ncbi:hypothetical protein GUJ93_ZPchr0013g36425 [Zizania palustris]|uniref:Epidermal patterning factor-like protein n=1 Tax=Zizania palustris TaxID=103762 RepID=A0A8J5WYU8_ZIZPA|nr:hypothetical protein GUJ93_ZPchr0013g36425 [Zizania palustris]